MERVRTSVAIPAELLRDVDEIVRRGRVVSRNEFLAVAIRHELERIQREAMGRAFSRDSGQGRSCSPHRVGPSGSVWFKLNVKEFTPSVSDCSFRRREGTNSPANLTGQPS